MNIVLIGYRCSGKTSVGKILSEELRRDFLDTDTLISERIGSSIGAFVSTSGWNQFRDMERETIKEISAKDNLIIATGGGVVMDQENVKNLKMKGRIFWLDADTETLRKRMKKDQKAGNLRPPLSGINPIDEVADVLNERRLLYEQASDVVIDTTQSSEQEVAGLILNEVAQIK